MSILRIGDYLPNSLEIIDIQNQIIPLRQLLHGVDKLIIIFIPYCFDNCLKENTVESLLTTINEKINEFILYDIRIVGISK